MTVKVVRAFPAYVLVPDAVSQMRVADQPHRLACPLSRPLGPCRWVPARRPSAPARVLPAARRRRSARPDRLRRELRCPRADPRSARARRSRPAWSAKASVAVAQNPSAGQSVYRCSAPIPSGHGAWTRQHVTTRHGSTTTAVSISVAGPLLPRSGRGWLAPNSLRTRRPRTHDRTLPGKAAGRRDAPRTRAGGSTPIGRRAGTKT